MRYVAASRWTLTPQETGASTRGEVRPGKRADHSESNCITSEFKLASK